MWLLHQASTILLTPQATCPVEKPHYSELFILFGILNPKATKKIARAAFEHFQIRAGCLKMCLSPYCCSQQGAKTNIGMSKPGAGPMDVAIFH